MGKVSGIRAVLALRDALDKEGLSRTSRYNGGAVVGWIEKNHLGSTGFSVRPIEDGRLDWHLVISGKPHMRYREYKDVIGDEVYELHSPDDPEVVYGKIRKAFSTLGLTVDEVRWTGHQTMWDDDVDYNVTTATPDWLADWDPLNREPITPAAPRLLSAKLNRFGRFPFAIEAEIPVYELAEGRYAMTREAADQFVAEAAERVSDRWVTYGTAKFDQADNLVLGIEGRTVTVIPETITNHWGDEVQVYPLPKGAAEPLRRYGSQIKVVIAGEEVIPDFQTLDGQYGGAPWNVEAEAASPKP